MIRPLLLALLVLPLHAREGAKIVDAARKQIGVTLSYDPAYTSLASPPDASAFLPGDLVTCTVPPGLPHIMVVSDRKTREGRPLLIHNIGAGTREEDVLLTYPLTGHYRLK